MSVSPSSASNPKPRELAEVVAELKPVLKNVMVLTWLASFLELLPILYMFQVYDRVVNSRDVSTLVLISVLLLLGMAAAEYLGYMRFRLQQASAEHLDRRLGGRVAEASFIATLNRTPRNANQALPDLKVLREFLTSPTIGTLIEVPTALPFLVLLWLMSPWLAVFAACGLIVTTILTFNTEARIHPALTEARGLAEHSQRYFTANLQHAGGMAAMGMEPSLRARWSELQRKFLQQQADASETAAKSAALSRLIGLVQSSAMLGLAMWLTLRGELAGGGGLVIVASMLGGKALAPLGKVVSSWKSIVGARDAYKRLDHFLEECPAPGKNMPLPAPKGELAADGLSAGPPGTNMLILRGVGFKLQPGETLAVVGPSGSGKSSLLRLLVGAWKPATGSVRLDGVEVSRWDKAELGPHLGYLSQEIELFEGSIADNIARFAPESSSRQEMVEAAAAAAGLTEFVDSLPERYATRIGPNGVFLSGGQRQKVGLARALFGEPALIVLDEPNSSLDEGGERVLIATLQRLKQAGKTLVVVTHRTSLLQVADKMLVITDGQQRLFGPRDEVIDALSKGANNNRGTPPARASA